MDFSTLATTSRTILRHLLKDVDAETSHDTDYNLVDLENKDQPLLSRAAEAELFLLATNFLLYVAMVIITTLICKIYFPEALERGGPIARSYSYRIAEDGAGEENDSYYGSDVDDDASDDEDEENQEVLDSSSEGEDREREPEPPLRTRNILEFDQARLSKAEVLKRLIFCSLVLNITFVAWGVLQVQYKEWCFAVSCVYYIR
jgi:hypothetical protein